MAGYAEPQNVEINLKLLGTFEISDRDGNLLKLRSSAEYALLAYLAIESDRAHSRDFLGNLIWPDLDEEKSRNNIRVSLSRVRKSLKVNPSAPPVILTEGQLVKLAAVAVWTDAEEFSRLVSRASHHEHGSSSDCKDCIEWCLQASEVFKGEFMQGFSLVDSLPFLEWMVLQQEKFHRQAIEIFDRLATFFLRRGELDEVKTYAHRQLELEPWREEAHRQLMRYFAISDQKSTALAQYGHVKQILEVELGVSPSNKTEELYHRIRKSRRRKQPDIPAAASPFVGRQDEQARIIELLSQTECRLLTLVGLGGVGKTRLAGQVTAQIEYAFLDGAVYVPLSRLSRAERIPGAIATAIGFSFGGSRTPAQQLIDYLTNKEVLLVLDNFEHLVDGVIFLEQLWENCPDVKLLVTSRQRLGIAQEWLFEVHGLPMVAEAPAVQLLTACIRRYLPEFSADGKEVSSLADLAVKVEGLPLALELIAPMIRAYSLQELLENINALEKPGLEQVFDRSWMLLTPEEQVGLIRLTIFRAPFSRDAAIQVAGIDLPMFSGFLDKSLVRRVDPSFHESEDQARSIFDFHPMMEQYLGEKLTSKPEVFDEVTTSHATYFLSYLEKMHAHLYTQGEPQAIKDIFLVYEDVTAAMLWGSLNFHLSSVRKGLRFFIHYFESLGAFKEGKDFFGSIVDALTEVKSRLEGENQELNQVHSRAYWFYGWHQMRLAEEDLALENYHLGLELARKSQAEEEEAGILNAIALIYRHRDIEKSNRYLQSALEIGYRIEHSWHIGSFNINLGINATMSENYEAAEGYLTESLRIYQDIGHYWGIIGAITNLGKLQMHRNNDSRARELLHEALGLVDHYKYVWLRIKILVALGDLAYKNESWQEAVVYYQQGFDSIEVFGDKSMREEAQEKFDHAMSMIESLEKMS